MMIKSPLTERSNPVELPDRVEASWFARQRLRFIESRLFWSGRVNRADLMRLFGVHQSVASKDLTDYQLLAPKNAVYDKSQKTYRAGSHFVPVFDTPTLTDLFGHVLLGDGFAAGRPLFDSVPLPLRPGDPVIVRNVIQAVEDGLAIHIHYRSLNNPDGVWRWIEPHAIIYDGQRWHVRAWCRRTSEYRDFNLGRMGAAEETGDAKTSPDDDTAWHRVVDVALRPHPSLSAAQAALVAHDYGMEDGELALPCREALLGYLLANLGLDHDQGPPRQLLALADPNVREKAFPKT
ncbi:WYL domain-containing protein [Caenispirillum bisanense]|uniref:WYL domain-containing protein n=1 Tax=Caenispirillum bisanense TaxID=414052 RepID=UPI0031D288E8